MFESLCHTILLKGRKLIFPLFFETEKKVHSHHSCIGESLLEFHQCLQDTERPVCVNGGY